MSKSKTWLGNAKANISRVARFGRSALSKVRLPKFSIGFRLACFLVFPALFLLSQAFPKPKALTAFEGNTEFLRYIPSPSSNGEIFLGNAVLTHVGIEDTAPKCLRDAAISVTTGAIEFSRDPAVPDIVAIHVEGKSRISSSTNSSGQQFSESVFLEIGRGVKPVECANSSEIRFPLDGNFMLGRETADGIGQLTSGKLRIYGRAQPGVLSWLYDFGQPSKNAVIFPAGEMDVPRGVRLGSYDGNLPNAPANGDMNGTVDIRLKTDSEGILVNFQTDASALYIWPRAATSEGSPPDRVFMTLSARLAGDPYFQWLLGIIGAAMLIIQLIAQRWPLKEK